MFTANTMSAFNEAVGMSLPGSASAPAMQDAVGRDISVSRAAGPPKTLSEIKMKQCADHVDALFAMMRSGLSCRKIMTREAFENGIVVAMALGGSTNLVLHCLALAKEADVALKIEDYNEINAKVSPGPSALLVCATVPIPVSAQVPLIGNLKPFGKYVMESVDEIGGVAVVMKALLEAGLLHPHCLTVTGRTVAENLADVALPSAAQVPQTKPSPTRATLGSVC